MQEEFVKRLSSRPPTKFPTGTWASKSRSFTEIGGKKGKREGPVGGKGNVRPRGKEKRKMSFEPDQPKGTNGLGRFYSPKGEIWTKKKDS